MTVTADVDTRKGASTRRGNWVPCTLPPNASTCSSHTPTPYQPRSTSSYGSQIAIAREVQTIQLREKAGQIPKSALRSISSTRLLLGEDKVRARLPP